MSRPAESATPGPVFQTPDPTDVAYFGRLHHAGIEVGPGSLMSPGGEAPTGHPDPRSFRRIDILIHHYANGGDASDRFFVHDGGAEIDAHEIVGQLSEALPQLGSLQLERIGDDESGPLVLRSGERLCGVSDEHDEGDSDDSVSVRSLVGAVNGHLASSDAERRYVLLLSDSTREAFVMVTAEVALSLLHADVLQHRSEEALVEFCAL